MDAEMWPEEQFGGISDEQFWDDLASDKPLETTARTAGSEPGPAQPPRRQRPKEQRPGEQRPGERPGEFRPPGRTAGPAGLAGAAGLAGTQAFAAAGSATGPQPVHQTGPQPVQATTQAFPASPSQSAQGTTQAFQLSAIQAAQTTTGPQPVRAVTQPQQTPMPPPADRSAPRRQQYQPPQPAPARAARPQPPVSQQPPRPAVSQPPALPGLPTAQQPGASSMSGTSGRGRHSSGEDPLTSAAYSLRSSGSVDGRSYQASRRAREMSRDQYEAAISQETQTFSMTDSEPAYPATPGYGYDMPSSQGSYLQSGSPRPGRRDDHGGTGGYPYPYGQPGQAAPHTSPYGAEDNGWVPDARDGWGARDNGRPPASGGRLDPGQYDAGRSYQNGYPAPYDPRGTDRR